MSGSDHGRRVAWIRRYCRDGLDSGVGCRQGEGNLGGRLWGEQEQKTDQQDGTANKEKDRRIVVVHDAVASLLPFCANRAGLSPDQG